MALTKVNVTGRRYAVAWKNLLGMTVEQAITASQYQADPSVLPPPLGYTFSHAYEDLTYDTADGRLGDGQYAEFGDGKDVLGVSRLLSVVKVVGKRQALVRRGDEATV